MGKIKIDFTPLIVAVFIADIFTSFGPDALAYTVLGFLGGMIGSFVRIVKRDETDVDNKFNFFYIKDIFVTLTWSLVGGFLPVVFILQSWTPILAVLCSLFAPKFWDVMEEMLPQILKSVVNKFWNTESKKETDKTK